MTGGSRTFLFKNEPRLPTVLDPPRFLVEWEPRWSAFLTAIGPAVRSSDAPLEGECRAGAIHGRNSILSFLLHVTALLVLISIPAHIVRSQRLLEPSEPRHYQVIYYSGNELPQVANDAGGAHSGESGRAGGGVLFHPTQVIHVARGNRLREAVADAPRLKLPKSKDWVANLLSTPAALPAPPTRASTPLPARSLLALALVPAPPNITRERLHQVPHLPTPVSAPPEAQPGIAGLHVPELGAAQVIPPPVSASPRAGPGTRSLTLPMNAAVAPPPLAVRQISSVDLPGFGARHSVIPPPPQTGGGSTEGGSSAIKTLGSLLGSGIATGVGVGHGVIVISASPGEAVGVPANGGPGALAMSPHGASKPGVGGSGVGTGIGRGNGPGSGTTGTGSGAATTGGGFGSGTSRPGTSAGAGPGGTGSGNGQGGIPGVTIVGGTVTLPSFSSPATASTGMSRSPNVSRSRPAITIIASTRAGGALNAYGTFKGSKVYTIYIPTTLGMAVMQYAERSANAHSFEDDLTPPEPLSSDLPPEFKRTRLLVSCVMDHTGVLKNLRVMESAPGTDKMLSALENWRFRPVLRGDQPVEVDVLLGFSMDTR